MSANLGSTLKTRAKIVSLEEANRMLPLLEKIVSDIMGTWERIIRDRTQLEMVEKSAPPSADRDDRIQELKEALNTRIDRINGYIREVEELGCFVEEFKRGVVNFPSLYLGRKVFLCWTPGENEVGFWHELDESFNERSRIRDERDFLVRRGQ